VVHETFGDDAEVMWNIFRCESTHRQFEADGTPRRSPTNDYGFAQINRKTWDSTAKQLGLDYMHSFEDNIKMAKHIYDVQGKTAWVCYHKLYS
jgi:hypothetical protein